MALAVAGLIVAVWVAVGLVFRRDLAAAWREPVLRYPVLILESDDWGPGPEQDAECLGQLSALLGRYRDATGRAPVMTLGLLLAVLVTRKVPSGDRTPILRRLDDPAFARIVRVVKAGEQRGVFAPQLHGMVHYWPMAIVAAAGKDNRVRDWLAAADTCRHEHLPRPLQCRWLDASQLPSRPLATGDIAAAVAEEMNAFRAILGEPARVVVPPAFVWDARVEATWAGHGVEVIVTPGCRFVGVARDGSLTADLQSIRNGQRAASGPTYLVRDDYFEPALGHRAERALTALAEKTALGRPTLLETHRFNFIDTGAARATAVEEVGRLLSEALQRFPALRFLSTAELATALGQRDPVLVDSSLGVRIHMWLRRVAALPGVKRLAWLTGLIAPAALAFALTRAARRQGPARG